MNSLANGTHTSPEVTNISQHGLWLMYHNEELFAPYEKFPWFKAQPIESILNVIEQGGEKDLNVELVT